MNPSAMQTAATRTLAEDRTEPGFGAGVVSLFSGLRFLTANPSAWPFALVPVVFFVGITAIVGGLGAGFLPKLVTPLLGSWAHKAHGALAVVVHVLVAILSVIIGILMGFLLAQPLSGPALEKIVRKVEGTLGAPKWPETSLLADIWRSIEGLLLTSVLSVPILGLLFLIEVIFPPAAIVATPLKVLVAALMLSWDLCDYPLSIRGMPVRERFALLRRHIGAVMGFGLGLLLLMLIPCGLFLALPVGAAGATELIFRLERWEARQKQ